MPRTFTGEQRRELARKGMAMPDGGYPIRNVKDLKNAIQAYGRGTNPPAVKKWIKKRAKELDAEDLLPENWEIEHSDDELMRYGVKGARAIEADHKERSDRRKATARRVGKKISRTAVSVGTAFVMDQIFHGGRNTRVTLDFAQGVVNMGKSAVYRMKNMHI